MAIRSAPSRRSLPCAVHSPLVSQSSRQPFSTTSSSSTSPSVKPTTGIRISTLFYGLVALGTFSTAYGLYEIYKTFTAWPSALRPDLRAAIDAKHRGDPALSAKHFQRAYDAAIALDRAKLGDKPYLKLTGIAIALGEALETASRMGAAFDAYAAAFELLAAHRADLSGTERVRAVALAHRLGSLAETLGRPAAEEEHWRVWAVEEALRIAREVNARTPATGEPLDERERIILAELEMPGWLATADVGAPIEALGEFYARMGKTEYALPLYLQAISLLIPPAGSSKKSTAEERCRGAQLMSNIAELFVRDPVTPQKIHQADAWARKALEVINKTKSNSRRSEDLSLCDQALAVTLFNLASINEMNGDQNSAKDLFRRALDQSQQIGMREGVSQSKMALMRLDRMQRTASSSSSSPHTTSTNT